MVTVSELTEALQSELHSILQNEYTLNSPTSHIGPSSSQQKQSLPSLQFETDVTPIKRGLHDELYVDEVNYDSNGDVSSITHRKDKTLFFDVVATVGGDDAKERDELYEAVDDHFSFHNGRQRDPKSIHSDVDEIRVNGTSDESRPDDAVRGDRLEMEIDFARYYTISDVTPLRDVKTNLSVEDQSEEEITTDETNFNYDYSITIN